MSKNAEGWVRHRGGKCPVEAGVMVELIWRDGEVGERISDLVRWKHETENYDIMAYRVCEPAEQVEACSKPELQIRLPDDYCEIYNAQAIPQGPTQWRDRIAEIDSTTMALTTERAELVQKLASEGFALIGLVVDPVEDMSDWRNWKEGDRIEVISKGFDDRDIGEMLTVDGLDNDDANQPVSVMGDDKIHSWPIVSRGHFLCIKWHSRPSA